jgi:hypothetical protein
VVAHGAILRIYEKKPLVADQVAINYKKADITPRQRAMGEAVIQIDDSLRDRLHGTIPLKTEAYATRPCAQGALARM